FPRCLHTRYTPSLPTRRSSDLEYSQKDGKKSFLETYFHTFLIKGNRKYADWLLKEIRKSDDAVFIQYCEQSYAVMLEERNDLIRSEEHTSELQSRFDLVCRLLL